MPRKLIKRPWTPEDTALLAKLLREGKDYQQISRRMNRSVETVRNLRQETCGVRTAAGRAGFEGNAG